jgi:type IV secretory pathway VirB10-like protein
VTITLSKKIATVAVTLLALALGLTFAAYSYGESTRKSDEQVSAQVKRTTDAAVVVRGAQAATDQAEAVKAAVKVTTKKVRRSQMRADRKVWMKRLKQHEDKARDAGYSTGNAAGYSSGNSAGYSSGHSSGVEEGIDTASDELTCSDDSDVALPACDYGDLDE